MTETVEEDGDKHKVLVQQIVELQREFAFENRGKESERRRRLRDIIETATSSKES